MNTLILATLLTASSGALPPSEDWQHESARNSLIPVSEELHDNTHYMTAGDCNPRVKVCEE